MKNGIGKRGVQNQHWPSILFDKPCFVENSKPRRERKAMSSALPRLQAIFVCSYSLSKRNRFNTLRLKAVTYFMFLTD